MTEVGDSGFRVSFSFILSFRFVFFWAISFSFIFFFILLIYLVLLSLCVRRFGFISIRWSICCVIRSCVRFCGRSAPGDCIRQPTFISFHVLSLFVVSACSSRALAWCVADLGHS